MAVVMHSEFPPMWRTAGPREIEAPKEISRKNLPAMDFSKKSALRAMNQAGEAQAEEF